MARPWTKWYFADWRADPGLRMCGLAARGLWAEILGYMHEGEPYGHFTIEGRVPELPELARLVGAPVADVRRAYAELEKNGVFSRTPEGVPYSRRMLRDEKREAERSKQGKLGGNPALKREDNLEDNHPDKPQRPEAKVQKETPTGPRTFWENGQRVPEAWKLVAAGERQRLGLPPINMDVTASKFEELAKHQRNPLTRTEWQSKFNNFVKDERAQNGTGFNGRTSRRASTSEAVDAIFSDRAAANEPL